MRRTTTTLFLLALVLAPGPLAAQSAVDARGASALGLALRQLGTSKRVLMIAAHPDDENTAVLATLALRDGADVAYLSLTRGEGGQNLIGPELQEGLGLIRSEELLAARELDGAQQYFSRAYDYGFSKSAEEAFQHWPRDSLIADAVLVIRSFRPDVVVSIFSGTPRDGHGQHQAAGIVAREAFAAAGDATRFPEQLRAGLAPHAPGALVQALYRGGGEAFALATGDYDPLLGRSHYQIAMASRSLHRSQDMGQAEPPGPQQTGFVRMAGGPEDDHPQDGLFAGIDTTLVQHARGIERAAPVTARLNAYQDSVARIRADFNPLDPAPLVVRLVAADAVLGSALRALPATGSELRFRIEDERAELRNAIVHAAGLMLEATSDASTLVPGSSFTVTLTAWNGGAEPRRITALAPLLPDGWHAESDEPADAVMAAPGDVVRRSFVVHVPTSAAPSEAYFLNAARDGDLYEWPADPAVRAMPFEAPPVRARMTANVGGVDVELGAEITESVVDKAFGERRVPLLLVPAVSVEIEPDVVLVRTSQPSSRVVRVTLRSASGDGAEGSVQLEAPRGWQVSPATAPATIAPGGSLDVEFTVTPPATVTPGRDRIGAVFSTRSGQEFRRGYRIIEYPHIRPRLLFTPAQAVVTVADVAIADDLTIGYIEGAGDDGAQALEQLGARVVALDSAAFADSDLRRFDAIVAGIRAYEVRADLVRHNRRVLDYVENGGVFVVQYNKYELVEGDFTPYPLTMARPHGRVTDEAAPVRLLEPAHPALSWPNRIDRSDFEGWAHERGLYFADTWDDRYVPLLAMSDPGEDPLHGSLLVAPYGAGTYVYTGLAFFRQFPEGIAGAYRLLANLVSLGTRPSS